MESLNILAPVEIRILGALAEKELTTPDYYPLTLNALKMACNQKSARNPVMELDEKVILRSLDSLIQQELVSRFSRQEYRVPKYRHQLKESLGITDDFLALLAILLLRGPQTGGELRTRTQRMFRFTDVNEVLEKLDRLAQRRPFPLVVALPRIPGQKEIRYSHLFAGMPDVTNETAVAEPIRVDLTADETRLSKLEETVTALQTELADLRRELTDFRSEFE